MNIDAVQQRPGDLAQAPLDDPPRTAALVMPAHISGAASTARSSGISKDPFGRKSCARRIFGIDQTLRYYLRNAF
ncbi:MAG: hypothetical protein JWO48_3579 [Bryobacterales bacterium]|nr:hypothetical protein [Bryobacterales bacterium]